MKGNRYLGYSVVCLTYNKMYESIKYASKITRTEERSISRCCRGLIDYTTNLEKTKLQWMFSQDYIEKYGEDAYWNLHRSTQDFYTKDWMEE